MAGLITPQLVQAVLDQYELNPWGIHGLAHWARVLEIGRRLAAETGARQDVVELFAVFHDSCRKNDGSDPSHGSRGAALARVWCGQLFDLDSAGLALLTEACETHTAGRTCNGDVTVQTCWDSDRLDLLRAGIAPNPARLCTPPAKDLRTIAWASQRALRNIIPELVWAEWQIERA